MTRRSQVRALAWGAGLAAAGAVIAYVLAGGRWAVAGVAIGAVAGAFAPSVYDVVRAKDAKREDLRATVEKAVPRSWARLLDPRREVVGFVGRNDELASLMAWHEDDEAGRLRLLTGPGGVGKTRLAVELAERVKELGWMSERIADGQEAAAIDLLRAVTGRRALLVVDYAETRVGLKQMLAALASDQGEGVRVLLLARSTGDWWDQLGVGDPAVWELVRSAREHRLSPVVAADLSDAEIIELAVRSFARELGLSERTVEIYGDSGTGQRRVLDLHAAALVAFLGDAATGGTVRVDIRTVLGELLRHEQHFWYDSARAYGLRDGQDGTTSQVLRQIVAAACLLGGATQDEARALPGRVPGMRPSVKIAEWLRALYPPEPEQADWIGSVQPDRLAELHVLHELDASPEFSRTCLTNLDARQALRAVTLLARASSDYVEAEELLSRTLPAVADLIADTQAPAETLMAIFNAIPYPTVVLGPAAVTIGQRIASRLPAGTEPAVRAYWLSNLGLRLAELARPADALTAEQEAVALYRELAAANPERYRTDLAATLNNLSKRFSQLGRPAEALQVVEEAAAIRRELAAADPDRYRPDLAATLNNLSVRLSDLGRLAEALAAAEETVAIRRELAAASPDRYRPDLATSLSNLGISLSELGHPEQALPVTEETVTAYRELAAASPDRYRPDLVAALNNLSVTLSELGCPAEALPVTEETVTVYRELAAASPDRYRPDLAAALNNLSVRFSELGQPAQAQPVIEETVAIHRELAAASPDRYRPDLAQSLTNLGATLYELGRPTQALPLIEETVAIHRELAAASPDRYRPDLAQSLTNLGEVLEGVGRPADADAARDEAAKLQLQPGR